MSHAAPRSRCTSARNAGAVPALPCPLERDHLVARPARSSNIAATLARAATTRCAVGKARRRSAIAGSAITASPSQLGASTSSRRGSGIERVVARPAAARSPRQRRHRRSRHRRCIHSHSSGWRRTYISSTSVHRCVNCVTASGASEAGGSHGVLVDEPVPPARQRQREDGNHRRAGPQRQRRQRGRGGRGTPEVVHVDHVGRVQVLIDQDAPRRGWPPARASPCGWRPDGRSRCCRCWCGCAPATRADRDCRAAAPAPTRGYATSGWAIACISQ